MRLTWYPNRDLFQQVFYATLALTGLVTPSRCAIVSPLPHDGSTL